MFSGGLNERNQEVTIKRLYFQGERLEPNTHFQLRGTRLSRVWTRNPKRSTSCPLYPPAQKAASLDQRMLGKCDMFHVCFRFYTLPLAFGFVLINTLHVGSVMFVLLLLNFFLYETMCCSFVFKNDCNVLDFVFRKKMFFFFNL